MQKEACFRCNGELIITNKSEDITFYQCNNCKRSFSQSEGKSITDRWMSPISLALYPIIFKTKIVSDECIDRSIIAFSHFDKNQKKLMIEEIEEELANPKQKLVDILDLKGTEVIARDYLSRLAASLKSQL